MKRVCLLPFVLCLLLVSTPLRSAVVPEDAAANGKTHLFLLAGQSNMVRLDPESSFTPVIRAALPHDRIFVVKKARNGTPIRRWLRKWKSAKGRTPKRTGDLYDGLLASVRATLNDVQPDTVSLLWMQGERDAWEKHGEVYADSLRGLVRQLQDDLGREDINVVIGRLSNHDLGNRRYAHWTMIREAQVQVAESCSGTEWVDTDDLNGPRNGLHYTEEGYRLLGDRFAREALRLIRKRES